MPIKIEIAGEHMGDIDLALNALNRPDPRTMLIDDLLAIVKARFAMTGFAVTISELPMSPENKPTPAEAEAIVEEIEEALAEPTPKRKRGRPAKVEPEEESSNVVEMTQPSKPDEDQSYVLDELSKRFGDPKQKNKTKAFIDRVAGRLGGVRLSRLEAKLCPAIKQEMEAYFAGGVNGHAA